MKIILYISLLLSLSFSCIENKSKTLIKHVYSSRCVPEPGSNCSHYDYYYAYNYQDKDSTILLKMIDTLSFDKSNHPHTHFFYKFDNSLPDTSELNKKMKFGDNFELKEAPGLIRQGKHLLLIFSYYRSYVSQGKKFPDSYSLKTLFSGESKQKYFIKDTITGLLKEVDEKQVLP